MPDRVGTSLSNPSAVFAASEQKAELSAGGRSRRKWIAASAVAVAGTWVACGESGDAASGAGSDCALGDPPPVDLPAFDAERCTDAIASSPPPPDESRFEIWNQELRAKAGGRESALVDLDALEHNMSLVGSQLGSRIALRLVAKSLPSVRLLEHMMVTACTNRIMAFSEGMVRDLLCRFGSDVDILLGRPASVEAAGRIFETLDARYSRGANPSVGVRWLVDTSDRMAQYRDLAEERGSTLKIAVELDVGLRRGGAIDDEELLAMLSIIDESDLLELAGFMGYDGHVPFAPDGADPDREFAEVQRRYADFVRAGSDAFPGLFRAPLIYNSGGSRTYHRYVDALQSPVNEVAMGSAFFYPSNFSNLPEQALRRATFLASPVLKRTDPAEIPFARGLLPAMAEDDPNLEVSFHLVAGGFPADLVSPRGLVGNPAIPGSGGVNNLLSNQAEWLGSRQVPLSVGDFIFYHPWEGDGIRWLSRLDVMRNGELVDQWSTFEPGIRLS
jgi:D-serine deaminase-like pyridoxal phosphate-dependent protein